MAIFVVILLIIIVCHSVIVGMTVDRTYDSVDAIPHNRYGLLLATSPITSGGARNFYFDNRIKAAEELYKAGKVDTIIASGGDYTQSERNGCNELAAITDSLMARGIPKERIILDFEGIRTIHSIYKFKQWMNTDSVTFISQKDHNERAIFLASWNDDKGLVIGYNAKPSHIRRNRIKNTLREYLAHVKVFIDLIFFKTPSYDGYVYNKDS